MPKSLNGIPVSSVWKNILEVDIWGYIDLNLKGNIWRLLSLPWDTVCKNSWKYDAFVALCHGMFFFLLSTSLASKDRNIFLLLLSWQLDFTRLFCHLVDSAEFNSWDWISGLCFKQSHELWTDCVRVFPMFSPLIWADKSYMRHIAFFYDLTFDRIKSLCVHKGF